MTTEARSVVEFARLKRQSFKGIVDVVYGGDKAPPAPPGQPPKGPCGQPQDLKRKADEGLEGPPSAEKMSKRQAKRERKQARMEGQPAS